MPAEYRSVEPALQGLHLTRTFGSGASLTRAVNDVSLDLYAGEAVLLMGPSGSGKSTLLSILAGLLPPTNGQVRALGQDLWALSERQRQEFRLQHCGMVFQGFNLFPGLTARMQLEIVLRLGEGVSAPEARRRADEMLTLLDLGDKASLRPEELSGGEQQRVAVGRALIKAPTFFFADEPTASLDWARGSKVVQSLRDAAHERQACVFIVSHDPRLRSHVDRVFNLEDGCLRETSGEDDPDEPVSTHAAKGEHI